MSTVRVEVRRLAHGHGLPLPRYLSPGSAGLDLIAAIATSEEIPPGEWRLIPSGLALALPPGYEAQIRPRSGLALKCGVTVLNSPGTIDSDYRGEIGVVMINHGRQPFEVRRGARIAQLVVAPVAAAALVEVDELAPSARAEGGFGSTG